jgi:hypothetical protein
MLLEPQDIVLGVSEHYSNGVLHFLQKRIMIVPLQLLI